MGRRQQTGFTVIEVVLVIAISGLIAMGVMSNSSRQVNVQNYRDGVQSFRDFLAGQFEDLDAVKNNQANGCGSHIRGAGDCFYSGKYISITPLPDDETRLVARPIQTTVEANDEISSVTVTSDTDDNVQSTKIDWGLQARAQTTGASGLGISRYVTIFRSPITGRVSSYVTSNNIGVGNFKNFIENPTSEATLASGDTIICLADPTNDTPGQWMAVRITNGAVDASGITTMAGQCS